MHTALILVFYFDLLVFTQSACAKFVFAWIFRCSVKEAVILLLSWNTFRVALSQCIVSWYYGFYFSLTLPTQSAYIKAWKYLVLHERNIDVASILVYPVHSISKLSSIVILNRLFWFTGYSHSGSKIFSFRKLLVLHWKSSNIALFMKHPVYIIFNVENLLNLACWFSFDTSYPNSMFKTYLLLNFACSAKRDIDIFLCEARYI